MTKVTLDKKAAALIGFAIKSGNAVFGADNIDKKPKTALVLFSGVSDNTRKRLEFFCGKHGTALYETNEPIEEVAHKNNCKVIGFLEGPLTEALKDRIIEVN